MNVTLGVDLHKTSRATNITIALLLPAALLAGYGISFYFHFATVALLFLNVVNLFYMRVQRRHALLRNFGVLAQARYFFESIGPEFRQYLFASDTEERPFNRQERAEVYRKAHGVDSAASFGSQNEFDVREVKIRHSMFPCTADTLRTFRIVFGEERGIESQFEIDKPVLISAMSFGALGENAVKALARGARRAGVPMNTGEGGFPKYHLEEDCSLIFQIGTAKFGVRDGRGQLSDSRLSEIASRDSVRMIEIKLSQGAKPGKGGLLPKEKISDEIAQLRGVPLGQDVVSPPGHAECHDAASTVRFIRHVQQVSQLPTGVKLCVGREHEFVEFVDEMIQQQTFPDFLTIDGAEGGTGAAPQSFIDSVGMPLWPALATVQRTLVERGVRDQLKVLASGKLINAARVITALSLGADACYSARGFMLSLGCIQALQCGNNTCPVGITTQDPRLQNGLDVESKSHRVERFVSGLTHDFAQLQAATGHCSHRDFSTDNLYIPEGVPLWAAVKGQ